MIEHGKELMIIALFPLLGLALEKLFSMKRVKCIMVISAVLLSPVITGYYYFIPYVYRLSALFLLGGFYSMFSRRIAASGTKIITAFCLLILSTIFLGFFSLVDAFGGYQLVKKRWYSGKYRIDYIIDQGFAGRPLYKYELNRFTKVPLFIKKVDVAIDEDSVDNCSVDFTDAKIKFNNCDGSIK